MENEGLERSRLLDGRTFVINIKLINPNTGRNKPLSSAEPISQRLMFPNSYDSV